MANNLSGLMRIAIFGMSLLPATAFAQVQPLIDTHIHYSHDAWDRLPPPEALKVLRAAGLSKAFVSSSSDEGTQKLYALAPEFIVPVLRPYRKRGELSTWMHDPTVIEMLSSRLAASPYAGIGEFHVFGADGDLPVMREVVGLAKRYGIFLHAHADAEAVGRLFAQDPDAHILWAHSGFVGPHKIRQMLLKHDNLLADLAFRGEFAQNTEAGSALNPAWRQLFLDYPDRFMIGTDTYTPERWYAVEDNAAFSRAWLKDLPEPVAAAIGYGNAAKLAERTLANWSSARAATGGNDCETGAPEGAVELESADYIAVLVPVSAGISIGSVFSADIVACRKDGDPFGGDISLTAMMPAHGHGMNTAATVSRTGPGRFRAEGLMFHMPGIWRIRIQLFGQEPDDELEGDLSVH